MRIAGVDTESIVNGTGIRYTIFTQGCLFKCKGCHNPSTHAVDGGIEVTITDIVSDILTIESLTGITLSGGDPILQAKECLELIKLLKEYRPYFDVWLYTGYTLQELKTKVEGGNSLIEELLSQVDVLVEGRYEEDKRTMEHSFVGSSNQRVFHRVGSQFIDENNRYNNIQDNQ